MMMMVMMMQTLMLMLMVVVANCYVKLHAFGKVESAVQPDWYAAVAVNAVTLINATLRGLFTYNVDPISCSATDYQHFDTHFDPDASPRLISYLQALANGQYLLL